VKSSTWAGDYLRWLADNGYPLAAVEEVVTAAKTSDEVYDEYLAQAGKKEPEGAGRESWPLPHGQRITPGRPAASETLAVTENGSAWRRCWAGL
jgi:hypothetical protein